MIKKYYQLTKPGIIYGNALTAAAGFLLASKGHIHFWLFVELLLGESLIVGSACAINNYIDRSIDGKMARTKNRALVKQDIPVQNALIFATFLGLLGFLVLLLSTNALTVGIGLVGYFDYIVLYSYMKRRSTLGTIVGSISGATPPVAGYCAVTNHFGLGALLLFLTLALWQMPHFYSIALYRYKDYASAKLPVLPVIKGFSTTKLAILCYIVAFTAVASALTFSGYTGYPYLVVILILGVVWFVRGVANYKKLEASEWGKKMFLFPL